MRVSWQETRPPNSLPASPATKSLVILQTHLLVSQKLGQGPCCTRQSAFTAVAQSSELVDLLTLQFEWHSKRDVRPESSAGQKVESCGSENDASLSHYSCAPPFSRPVPDSSVPSSKRRPWLSWGPLVEASFTKAPSADSVVWHCIVH